MTEPLTSNCPPFSPTSDGELSELVEEFSEGRVQYAFAKVKDPNSGLPKYILVAWCGGGVPERTKGYFTSHTAAVSKILHGYHVQITARSESDLEPATIMQKVADASGAKYSAGVGVTASAPPPVKSKPVFTPTSSSAARTDPIVRSRRNNDTGEDGWGDAPPVSRSEIQKVESAYKPTKVNMAELTNQKQAPSRFVNTKQDDTSSDVVKGGYQPIGKVDIAAIRAQAKEKVDDRPAPVKGSYEPVGKVDIAAIRAKAKPSQQETPQQAPPQQEQESEAPRPLADRAAAFSQPQSERLTELPKPKVAKKFGGASSFTGTKPLTPGGMGLLGPGQTTPAAAPVGSASRTFADQGGKTPAQLWAEKKAKQGGSVGTTAAQPPVQAQKSGGEGWKSGYSGKSWAPVATSSAFGRPEAGQVSAQNTGEEPRVEETPTGASSGGVSALKDRFKDTAPISAAPPSRAPQHETPAEQQHDEGEESDSSVTVQIGTRGLPPGGFALPGMPPRPAADDDEEEDADAYRPERETSPVRIAVPVSRGAEIESPEAHDPPPIAVSQLDIPKEEDLSNDRDQANAARGQAQAVAEQTFEPEQVSDKTSQGGHQAIVQYDYEKAEDNEIELVEGQYVTDIDMVDDDWWLGTNSKGERGLFPSNYVEIVETEAQAPAEQAVPPPPPAAARPVAAGPTATALYDYEAAEDNGKLF